MLTARFIGRTGSGEPALEPLVVYDQQIYAVALKEFSESLESPAAQVPAMEAQG